MDVRPVIGEGPARSLEYDTLIVAGGSHYSYFGHDESRDAAPEVKSLESAVAVRARLLSAFEAAELDDDELRRRTWPTFVVVGAGPNGFEMAGQITELARDTLRGTSARSTAPGSRAARRGGRPHAHGVPPVVVTARRPCSSTWAYVGARAHLVGVDEQAVTVAAAGGEEERIDART